MSQLKLKYGAAAQENLGDFLSEKVIYNGRDYVPEEKAVQEEKNAAKEKTVLKEKAVSKGKAAANKNAVSGAVRRQGRGVTDGIVSTVEYFILPVLLILIWLILGQSGRLNPVIMPSLQKIVSTTGKLLVNGSLASNAWISLVRVLKGYFIAAVLGVGLGIAIGLSRHLERLTQLIVQILKPIPPIAWIPLVILWFGIGESGKVFLIFLGGFFTILINVIDGIHQKDEKLQEVSRVMETPVSKQILLMVIPGAAPNIFTGLRTGLTSCWMCVVAAELVSSTTGLGYLIMNARQFGNTDVVIVGMLAIGLIGKIMDSILKAIERKVIRW